MVKVSPQKRVNGRIPTVFFVIAGIIVLGITGFLLSDAGKKFYEPDSNAATGCTYGKYEIWKCLTNTGCGLYNSTRKCVQGPLADADKKLCRFVVNTTSVQIVDCCKPGQLVVNGKCVDPNSAACNAYTSYERGACSNVAFCPGMSQNKMNYVTNASVHKCLLRTDKDYIMDSCTSPKKLNAAGTVCEAAVVPTPAKIKCTIYKSYADGTCNNPICPDGGRYCAQRSLTGAVDGDGKLCQHARTSDDFIQDCCPAGKILNSAGSACVNPSTPTPTPTPKIDCKDYITYPLQRCTNDVCATGSGQKCAATALTDAHQVKCVRRGAGVDEVNDCCAIGKVISGTSCVSAAPTATNPPNPTATNPPSPTSTNPPNPTATNPPNPTVIQTTVVPSGSPTYSVSPTATPSITPSFTASPSVTISGTGTPANIPSMDPTSSIPPTTTTVRTPSVTHTPSATGFEEDILVYVGGALYATGVIAFITARYLGVVKRKSVV